MTFLNNFKAIQKVALVFAGLMLCASAQAGPYKNFGSHFAWVNNFDNSAIGSSFGTGTTANMSFNWNFGNTSKLYGYPAIVRGWRRLEPDWHTLFPMQISRISGAPCYFSYSSGGSNMAGDFAYAANRDHDLVAAATTATICTWT